MPDLQQLATAVRSAPGLQGKRAVRLIERLGAGIDGDDAALVAHRGEHLVLCGEAISPPLVAADPFGAGSAAVITTVSDVRAMAGRP
ncbi:MAG: AIR synthase related protein, partial [Solirubrobacteraceae bacterium]